MKKRSIFQKHLNNHGICNASVLFENITPRNKKGNSIFSLLRIDQQVFLTHDIQTLPQCLNDQLWGNTTFKYGISLWNWLYVQENSDLCIFDRLSIFFACTTFDTASSLNYLSRKRKINLISFNFSHISEIWLTRLSVQYRLVGISNILQGSELI